MRTLAQRILVVILFAHAGSALESGCLTKSGGSLPCHFPYILNGQIEFSCTRSYKSDGRLEGWCPTQVDPVTLEGSEWNECRPETSCPLMRYHSHDELITSLQDLADNNPDLAETFDIGESVLGNRLFGIRISRNVRQPRESLKPMVKLLANMHGNEPVGRELLIHFAAHILGSYGIDERISTFINTTDLWLIPTINPDGFGRASEGSCEGGGYREGRYNEGRKDLNRDFPTWRDINKIDLEKGRQIETIHLIRFIQRHPFVLSANFHDGAVLVNYPWDDYHNNDTRTWIGPNQAPDHDVFYHLSTTYSFNHPTMTNPDVCTKWGIMDDGITNGAEWYPVIGGMQDFNYIYTNAMEMTMELSCCKFPPRKILLKEWDKNRESIMSYIEQVHRGIKGIVRDQDGRPINDAVVKFRNPVTTNSSGKDVSTSEEGEYWKILMPGRYQVTALKVTQDGRIYDSDWVDVFVSDGQAATVDLRLKQRPRR